MASKNITGYMSSATFAETIGMLPASFNILAKYFNDLPIRTQIGKSCYYKKHDIDNWLETHDYKREISKAYKKRRGDRYGIEYVREFDNKSAVRFFAQ